MRIVLEIEYDGTDYCGWQIQPNGITVQEEIERAIEKVTGKRETVIGSGRTDSGVHAAMQVAHFDTDTTIPPEKFALALNAVLPKDIRIKCSKETDENFHARFSAKKKTYVYKMYTGEVSSPLKDRYALFIPYKINVENMQKAATLLVGTHDFKCFLAANSEVKDTIRTIYSSTVTASGNDIEYTVSGNGFLYNMVRIIAGTLLKVGEGKLKAEEIGDILTCGDRARAGITLPARGLTLLSVEYPE